MELISTYILITMVYIPRKNGLRQSVVQIYIVAPYSVVLFPGPSEQNLSINSINEKTLTDEPLIFPINFSIEFERAAAKFSSS